MAAICSPSIATSASTGKTPGSTTVAPRISRSDGTQQALQRVEGDRHVGLLDRLGGVVAAAAASGRTASRRGRSAAIIAASWPAPLGSRRATPKASVSRSSMATAGTVAAVAPVDLDVAAGDRAASARSASTVARRVASSGWRRSSVTVDASGDHVAHVRLDLARGRPCRPPARRRGSTRRRRRARRGGRPSARCRRGRPRRRTSPRRGSGRGSR